MRVVFLGTPEFAVPSLEVILNLSQKFEVVGVITQPDRPSGRGQRLTAPPVKLLAIAHDIPVFQTDRLQGNLEALEFLKNLKPDLNIVVAFGQILTSVFFNYPRLGTVNVHASLLPKYRGASPIVHTLINGETYSGVTIMKIDKGMDTGDILSQVVVPVSDDITSEELSKLLSEKGADLLVKTIPEYAKGEIQICPQEHTQSTYASIIKKEETKINWQKPAVAVHNLVRALNPVPAAFTRFRGEKIKIWRTAQQKQITRYSSLSNKSGEIVTVKKHKVVVQCGHNTFIRLLEVQLPNRKRISANDFINGASLKRGELLG